MITTEGKAHIKRYLAGFVPAIAQSACFGIGNRAEVVGDMALQIEVARSPINYTNYDFAANKLVYKAEIPADYVGKIYEVGVYSLEYNPAAADFGSRLITTFDSATEDWVDSTTSAYAPFTALANRVGTDALSFTPALSTASTYALRSIVLDLSGYSSADTFNFGFNVGNANTSAVRVRFLTDASNYYDFNLGAQTAGYKLVEVTKSTAVSTGAPSWANITEIQITVTSGAGGASSLEFDVIRIEDKDSISLDYILVARKVLPTPITSIAGQSQDFEFTLDVTV